MVIILGGTYPVEEIFPEYESERGERPFEDGYPAHVIVA